MRKIANIEAIYIIIDVSLNKGIVKWKFQGMGKYSSFKKSKILLAEIKKDEADQCQGIIEGSINTGSFLGRYQVEYVYNKKCPGCDKGYHLLSDETLKSVSSVKFLIKLKEDLVRNVGELNRKILCLKCGCLFCYWKRKSSINIDL